jgi:hypothetical protein
LKELGKSHAEEFFAEFDILRWECGYVGAAYDQSLIRIVRGAMPERIRDRIDYYIPRITTYEAWKEMALDMDGIWRSIQGDRTLQPQTAKSNSCPPPKPPVAALAAGVTPG